MIHDFKLALLIAVSLLFIGGGAYLEIMAMWHCGFWSVVFGKATLWMWAFGFCGA